MNVKILFLILLIFPIEYVVAQQDMVKYVQLSGLVLTADSSAPIPNVNITILNTYSGVSSNLRGFFTLVVRAGDKVQFSAVGFKKIIYKIPESIEEDYHSVVVQLKTDTIVLPVAIIYPWATKEAFKKAFIESKAPIDDIVIAENNLKAMEIRKIAINIPMDGNMNYKNYYNNQFNNISNRGHIPMISIFSPTAWIEFFKALKRGDFKNKN